MDHNSETVVGEGHSPKLVRTMAVTFFLTLIVLAVFFSGGLVTVTYDLPPHPVSESIASSAESWHQLMQDLGPAQLTQAIADQTASWRETRVVAEEF